MWGVLPWWKAGFYRPSTKCTSLPALGPCRVSSYSSPSHWVTWPSPLPSLHICPLQRHGLKDLLFLLPLPDTILILPGLLWVLLYPPRCNKVSPCGASLWRNFLDCPHVIPTLAFQLPEVWMVCLSPSGGERRAQSPLSKAEDSQALLGGVRGLGTTSGSPRPERKSPNSRPCAAEFQD